MMTPLRFTITWITVGLVIGCAIRLATTLNKPRPEPRTYVLSDGRKISCSREIDGMCGVSLYQCADTHDYLCEVGVRR